MNDTWLMETVNWSAVLVIFYREFAFVKVTNVCLCTHMWMRNKAQH